MKKSNPPAIARLVERIHGCVHSADVELPAALEEIGDLVEKQTGMPAIHVHALAAQTTALADRGDGLSDGSHQRDCEVVRLDHGVDVARRLHNMNLAHRFRRKTEPFRHRF